MAPQRDAIDAAVTAVLLEHGATAAPEEFARAVGVAANAAACVVTLEDVQFTWFASGTDVQALGADWSHWALSTEPEISVALSPSAAVTAPESLAVLVPALAAAAWRVDTDRRERAVDAVHRALSDERWRATAEMEHERRQLERDLHDGAQHHLVALRMAVAVAEHASATGATAQPPRSTDALRAQLDEAERLLVETARGMQPRLLSEGGLRAALAELESDGLAVSVDVARLAPAVESALYFIVLEGVSNARKHASGAHIAVRVRSTASAIEAVVEDDGPGFEVADGAGTPRNLVTRAAAVGGRVDVRSAPGEGTTVTAVVPY